MIKTRIEIPVQVDLTADDETELLARIQHLKHSLRWALSTSSTMKDQRQMVDRFAVVHDVLPSRSIRTEVYAPDDSFVQVWTEANEEQAEARFKRGGE